MGRTEPLRFFSVSRWVFASPWVQLVLFPDLRMRTYLGVLSHVLEETCNSAHALIEVVALLERI